ncbi:MAG: substrate-binding domain-containing protein [Anaerolineae bacterium]|nr:substrate-binding domain-containing protein [Anaerolineae bacterium]
MRFVQFIQLVKFVLLLELVACAPQPLTVTRQPVHLRLAASDACSGLLEEWARAYHRAHPWVTFEVAVYNDATAQEYILSGGADGGAFVWAGNASVLWTIPAASDAVAIIVHPDVPVEDLTLEQVRELLRGRIGEWPDGTPVQVVVREEGAGTHAVVRSAVMGPYPLTLIARVVASDESMLSAVAQTPGAIGYVPASRVREGVRPLRIGGLTPAPSPDYPLSYPILLATVGEPTGELRQWIQWALGPQGQAIAEKALRPGP